jgi:hypothetical protein
VMHCCYYGMGMSAGRPHTHVRISTVDEGSRRRGRVVALGRVGSGRVGSRRPGCGTSGHVLKDRPNTNVGVR